MSTNNTFLKFLTAGTIIVCLFLASPQKGNAQYPLSYNMPLWIDQGFSSWRNQGLSFSSFGPYSGINYSPTGFSSIFPYDSYGGYSSSPFGYGSYGYGSGVLGSYGPGFYGLYAPYYPGSYPGPPPLPDDFEYEHVSAVEVKSEYVYLAVSEDEGKDNSQYLWIVDVSDPDDPERVKRMEVGHYPSLDLYLHENYLYWVSQSVDWSDFDYDIEDEGIVGVFDISKPDDPSLVDTLKIDISEVKSPVAAFNNDRFYLLYSDFDDEDMEDEGILFQIDISNPENLTLASTSEIDFRKNITVNQILVKDNLAFMSAHDIYVFDLSDPQNPSRISKFEYDKGRIKDLALLDHFLLATASEEGLLVIDIESPNSTELISVVEMPWPFQIFLKGRQAYVSDFCKGLELIDLSDPEDPEKIYGYRLPSHKMFESTDNSSSGYLSDSAVEGNLAFTVSHSNVQIWNISERGDIEMTGEFGPDIETLGPTGEIIDGELTVMLTKEAVDMISLGEEDDIAVFGIDSLDELNNDFEVSKITQVSSSGEAPALIDDLSHYKERTFVIKFSKSFDTFDVWDAYMDNPFCLIAEFSYEDDEYSNGGGNGIFPIYSPGGYGLGGYGLGGYGLSSSYISPYSFPAFANQGFYSPYTSFWGQSSLFPSSFPNIYFNFQNSPFPGGNSNPWSYPVINPIGVPAYPMWNNAWGYGTF